MPNIGGAVSLREIILELRKEQMNNDDRYNELMVTGNERDLRDKEADELTKLMDQYDEENYYRKVLRYFNNIFDNGEISTDGSHGYNIPVVDKGFVKLLLREYMSPFMKILRSKRNSQLSFSDFDNFITKVEQQIQAEYQDKEERKAALTKLNLYTNYQERRRLIDLKEEVEKIIANDWSRIHELSNGQLKSRLIEAYYKGLKELSNEWQKEIDIQVEIEEVVIDELIEEEWAKITVNERADEALGTAIENDHQKIHVPYSDSNYNSLLDGLSTDGSKEEFDRGRKKWEKIIRLEYDKKK